jgi:hypothetical protein
VTRIYLFKLCSDERKRAPRYLQCLVNEIVLCFDYILAPHRGFKCALARNTACVCDNDLSTCDDVTNTETIEQSMFGGHFSETRYSRALDFSTRGVCHFQCARARCI